jgi:toxin YoeB
LAKIDRLIEDILEHPFAGIGKPEPLRYEWSGYWSRRITGEHRLVYRVEGDTVFIAQCRFHYD